MISTLNLFQAKRFRVKEKVKSQFLEKDKAFLHRIMKELQNQINFKMLLIKVVFLNNNQKRKLIT